MNEIFLNKDAKGVIKKYPRLGYFNHKHLAVGKKSWFYFFFFS